MPTVVWWEAICKVRTQLFGLLAEHGMSSWRWTMRPMRSARVNRWTPHRIWCWWTAGRGARANGS